MGKSNHSPSGRICLVAVLHVRGIHSFLRFDLFSVHLSSFKRVHYLGNALQFALAFQHRHFSQLVQWIVFLLGISYGSFRCFSRFGLAVYQRFNLCFLGCGVGRRRRYLVDAGLYDSSNLCCQVELSDDSLSYVPSYSGYG